MDKLEELRNKIEELKPTYPEIAKELQTVIESIDKDIAEQDNGKQ